MKKIYLLAFAAVLFAACSNNNPDEGNKLKVDPLEITAPNTGGDYTVTVTSPEAWTATCTESWLKVSPMKGEAGTTEVRIKINANKDAYEHGCNVVFQSGSETVYMVVTLAAKEPPYLNIASDMSYKAPKEGGTYTVKVESNIRWSASSNVSWAKVSKGVSQNNDNITITVDAATTPQESTATITFTSYGDNYAGEQYVVITRGGTDATSMSVDQKSIDAPAEGGNYTIQVNTTAQWRVYKSWELYWVTINGGEGSGNGSFSITVDPATSLDATSGIITIEEVRSDSYAPVVVQVEISRKGQPEATLSIYKKDFTVSGSGGVISVNIKSNYPWEATSNYNKYLSLSATSGEGNGTLVIIVKPATDDNDLYATVVISSVSDYGNESVTITIHRYPRNDYERFTVSTIYNLVGDKYVAKVQKVYFAKSNIGLQTSNKNLDTEWRFGKNQYDMTGELNTRILGLGEDGWLDLFSWGSGNHPLFTTDDDDDFADWGNNKIVNGDGYKWRTLSMKEWSHVVSSRRNAAALQGFGNINNVNGLILLPDGGLNSSTLHFKPGVSDYTTNTYSEAEWKQMEASGCIFLPAAGAILSVDKKRVIAGVNEYGRYWTCDAPEDNSHNAYVLQFDPSISNTPSIGEKEKNYLYSVRLVRDTE